MKNLTLSQLLLAVAMLFAPVSELFADTFQVGALQYTTKSDGTSVKVDVNSSCSGEVVIPETVQYGGVTYNVNEVVANAFASNTGITSVYIPDCVEITSSHTSIFSGATSLLSVRLPQTLTVLPEQTFDRCTSLTSVTIPETVTSIGYGAFYRCSALTSIVIPDGVTTLNMLTFGYCSSLSSVKLSANLKSIASTVFGGCSSLSTLELPESLTSLTAQAFASCGLTSIKIPSQLATIPSRGFYNNTLLQSVDLGSGVSTVSAYAFSGCNKITSVTINRTTPPSVNANSFSVTKSDVKLYVPDSAVDTYKSASVWGEFDVQPISNSTAINSVEQLASDLTIRVLGQTVRVEGVADGSICKLYAINGVLLNSQVVVAGQASFHVGNGVYIIMTANKAKKVCVR